MARFIQRRTADLCPWKGVGKPGTVVTSESLRPIKGKGIFGIQKLSLQGPQPVTASLEQDGPAGRWG